MILKKTKPNKGFTLIELLIVIAIISILAAVVFVVLNPLKRFRAARDASRWSDVSGLLSAIKVDQVDNGGNYLTSINNMSDDTPYMIVDGDMDTGCDDAICDITVGGDTNCVDLSGLVDEGYLGEVPISPSGNVTWDQGALDGDTGTGYVITKNATGILEVQACESEDTNNIKVAR